MADDKSLWEWQEEPAEFPYPRDLFIELLIEAGALPSAAERMVDELITYSPVVQ
jgi:hypothetical protein